jgi:hypothetical protein
MHIGSDGIRNGISRLLTAPRDVLRWDAHIGDPGKAAASPGHRSLFDRYKVDIRRAAKEAERIWDEELAAHAQELGDQKQATRAHWMMMPAGPGARPFFVALVRKYWLACDALNKTLPPEQAVAPEGLLLAWLADERLAGDPAVKVLACLPYWPVGLDADGQWR